MKKIGRYELREPLGAGAMADVYAAFDPEINRTLAIKMLKPERCVDDEYVTRFVREAKAAGALSHKNIVTIFDVGAFENKPYILMEMVDGQPMDEALAEKKRYSLKAALNIGLQLADALDYAHKNGIVHRDIKPSNIIFLKDGETVKITDFGIARVEDPTDGEQTVAGMVLGTPQYMSPEQVLGKPVDGRSDLFSVGVVLYQLLMGEKPFPGDTVGSLMVQITQEDAPSMRRANNAIPSGVQHIVEKLMAKSPDARFPDGAALKAAIKSQLRQLEDAEDNAHRGYISLRYKLTGALAAAVALAMIISVSMIQSRLDDVLTKQTVEYGGSMTNLIATQSAWPLVEELELIEEAANLGQNISSRSNARIERFVKDAISRQSFVYLHVANLDGLVRASSDETLIGQPMPSPATEPVTKGDPNRNVAYVTRPDGERLFVFTAPVTLSNTAVGEVKLGLSRNPVNAALRTSLALLSALSALVIGVVAASAYYLIGLLSKPMKTLRSAIQDLEKGHVDVRISQTRDDEVGDVFAAFNGLAARLSQGGGDGTLSAARDVLDEIGINDGVGSNIDAAHDPHLNGASPAPDDAFEKGALFDEKLGEAPEPDPPALGASTAQADSGLDDTDLDKTRILKQPLDIDTKGS